jgi:hypothetical protein
MSDKHYSAEKALDWAQAMLDLGHDSMWVYEHTMERLDSVGLSAYDLRHYKERLEQITALNA